MGRGRKSQAQSLVQPGLGVRLDTVVVLLNICEQIAAEQSLKCM
jgi:hypothetical protein